MRYVSRPSFENKFLNGLEAGSLCWTTMSKLARNRKSWCSILLTSSRVHFLTKIFLRLLETSDSNYQILAVFNLNGHDRSIKKVKPYRSHYQYQNPSRFLAIAFHDYYASRLSGFLNACSVCATEQRRRNLEESKILIETLAEPDSIEALITTNLCINWELAS